MRLGSLAGVVVLLAPGVAMAWAFFPRVDWAKSVVLAVVLALTVPPGILLALNAAFDVPLRRSTAAAVHLGVAAVAVATGFALRARTRETL